ncbi:hypothetical protein BH20ACI4_BH20ACI4_17790 [soil metagenome]
MSNFEDYTLVWQQCPSDGKLAERFFVPSFNGTLPFFLSGEDLISFETDGKAKIDEEKLLKGILFGLYELDNDPKPWHQPKNKETYLYLLDVLGNGFGFTDPEKMILDVAANIRIKNGNNVSRIVLNSGLDLIPFSSKIRSDLICDNWAVMSEYGIENQLLEQLLEQIIELSSETYLESILPDAKEIICYYGFCAMVLNNESVNDIENYLQEFVYPNVKMQSLKIKIRDLLLKPDSFTAKDLRII